QELAYIPLLRMHKSDGGMPDEAKLGELVRALRTAAPSGRALGLLRAEELAATARLGMAQAELLRLPAQGPPHHDPLALPAPPSPPAPATLAPGAEGRLRPLLDRAPRRSAAAVALAAALGGGRARGDTAAAEATLRAAITAPHHPRDAAVELEETLRRAD